jgi:hypothetical protein
MKSEAENSAAAYHSQKKHCTFIQVQCFFIFVKKEKGVPLQRRK